MYQYKFTDSDTENKVKENELKSKIKEIENSYKITPKAEEGSYGLERLTYEVPSESEISEKAANELSDYKTTSLKGIEDSHTNGTTALDLKASTLETEKDSNKQNVLDVYDSAKESASNDALKRGLARSSIAINNVEGYEREKINELKNIENEYRQSIEKLDNQRTLLEQQKANALSNFDIAYAIKLTDKINTLTEESNKKQQEVIKYNNQIAEKEANLNSKNNSFLKSYIDTYGTYGINQLKDKAVYDAAYEHFSSMDRDTAVNELLSNPEYKTMLGDSYKKLLLEMDKR